MKPTALKNFVDIGGKVTRQVGNYRFGFDGNALRYEVLCFDANTGKLVKSKLIKNNQMASIKSVDDIYDFMFDKPTAPDFIKTINKGII